MTGRRKVTNRKIFAIISLGLLFFSFINPVLATSSGHYENITTDQTKYIDKYFEIDKDGNFKVNIYLGDQKISTFSNTSTEYNLTDHLGSPTIITDRQGNILETNDYDPYGQVKTLNSTIDNTKKFTGKELDQENNLQYYGARYLDNTTGRFMSVDPAVLKIHDSDQFEEEYDYSAEYYLSNPQNLNSYSYVANNPVKNTDSDGQIVDTAIDVGFVTYDAGNTLYKGGQFVGSLFSGNLQQASDASKAFLGSFVDLSVDTGAALIPFVPAGLTKVDDVAKLANKAKNFDAVAQQSKMLKGIENSRAVNTLKSVFKTSDTIPGGTMGALRNEIMTGNKTKDIFHTEKARNVINNIRNVFKSENLNKIEKNRLQGIKNSLQSLIKHIK